MTGYAARLITRLGEQGATLASDPQLEALLDGLFDRAEGRLPHRPIRRDVMVDRIADALLSSDELPDREALTRLNASDLYLTLALAARDVRAFEIAESELMPVVRQSVFRIDPTPQFVDAASERVRERLLIGDACVPPVIAQYRGTGPLARWVRVIAGRIALDLRAAGELGELAGDPSSRADAPSDPALDLMWRLCADEYEVALAGAVMRLPRRERNLLRQHYLEDLNADALGCMYRVSPSMTLHWLQQIEGRLTAATCSVLRAKLAITEGEDQSIERLVESRLPHSLPRMLRGEEHGDGRDARGAGREAERDGGTQER